MDRKELVRSARLGGGHQTVNRRTQCVVQAVFQNDQLADPTVDLAALSCSKARANPCTASALLGIVGATCAGLAAGRPAVSSYAIANPAARAVMLSLSLLMASPTSACRDTNTQHRENDANIAHVNIKNGYHWNIPEIQRLAIAASQRVKTDAAMHFRQKLVLAESQRMNCRLNCAFEGPA